MKTGARYRAVRIATLLLVGLLSTVGRPPLFSQQFATPTRAYRIAPDFSRIDLKQKKITLASYRGKVVLLNFWATWCGPCLTEMPTFAEWQKHYGSKDFQVIGISMDDAAPPVISTVARLKLNYPVLMGDEHLGEAYGGILGLPATFLIDRNGRIRARYQGAANLPKINDDIETLLKSH